MKVNSSSEWQLVHIYWNVSIVEAISTLPVNRLAHQNLPPQDSLASTSFFLFFCWTRYVAKNCTPVLRCRHHWRTNDSIIRHKCGCGFSGGKLLSLGIQFCQTRVQFDFFKLLEQECTHLLGPDAVRPRTDTKMGKSRGGA
ncbi:unnamed protein product, partial [Ectocarpus sp. 13 AM-2016]